MTWSFTYMYFIIIIFLNDDNETNVSLCGLRVQISESLLQHFLCLGYESDIERSRPGKNYIAGKAHFHRPRLKSQGIAQLNISIFSLPLSFSLRVLRLKLAQVLNLAGARGLLWYVRSKPRLWPDSTPVVSAVESLCFPIEASGLLHQQSVSKSVTINSSPHIAFDKLPESTQHQLQINPFIWFEIWVRSLCSGSTYHDWIQSN